jgi:chromosome partitioning protein
MATVAVLSRKGGCGKSTLSTHIAAYLAGRGVPVTLGDLDHQQSARTWLGYRPDNAPAIGAWVGNANALVRPPIGTPHLVLDTPGGLHGLALFKVVMLADAILIPVCSSAFDRDASAACWAELRAHPRVRSGRCRVACVGMRLDSRTDAEAITHHWAESQGLDWLGGLRSTQLYVRAAENGLSIFDMPRKLVTNDLAQWSALMDWIDSVYTPHKAAAQDKPSSVFAALQRPFASGDDFRPKAPAVPRAPAWVHDAAFDTAQGALTAAGGKPSGGLAARVKGLFGGWGGAQPLPSARAFDARPSTRSAPLGM